MKNRIDTTINSYNKSAEKYSEKFSNYRSYTEKLELFQKEYIAHGATVLDIGCGPGNCTNTLFQNDSCLEITGIDLSEKMIELAKENVPHAQFSVKDIREITTTKKFDVVIASFCIVHLTNEETEVLLAKFVQLLNENGSLYLSCMEGKESGFETTSFSENEIFFNYYHRNWIAEQLSKNGFTVEKIVTDEYPEENGSVTTDLFFFCKLN